MLIIRAGRYTYFISDLWLIGFSTLLGYLVAKYIEEKYIKTQNPIKVSEVDSETRFNPKKPFDSNSTLRPKGQVKKKTRLQRIVNKVKLKKNTLSLDLKSKNNPATRSNLFRGGSDVEILDSPKEVVNQCVEMDEPRVYEIQDPLLKALIRDMLGLKGSSGIIIVTIRVFATALARRFLAPLVSISTGVHVLVVSQTTSIVLKVGLAFSGGLLLGFANLLPQILIRILGGLPSTRVVILGLLLSAQLFLYAVNCNKYVSELPMVQNVPYVELVDKSKDIIYMTRAEDDAIYIPDMTDKNSCAYYKFETLNGNLYYTRKTGELTLIKRECKQKVKLYDQKIYTTNDIVKGNDRNFAELAKRSVSGNEVALKESNSGALVESNKQDSSKDKKIPMKIKNFHYFDIPDLE